LTPIALLELDCIEMDGAPAEIEARIDEASSQIAKLERERDEYKKLVRLLQEANERLKRGPLGAEGRAFAA
jgi:hypothetical protein